MYMCMYNIYIYIYIYIYTGFSPLGGWRESSSPGKNLLISCSHFSCAIFVLILFCFFNLLLLFKPTTVFGLLLRVQAQWYNVNHCCFIDIDKVISLNGVPWGVLTENNFTSYIMHKLTDLFCLKIVFAKFNILALLFCTFLQIFRDTPQQHFPKEQGHSVFPHRVYREAFHEGWGTNCFR